MNIMVQGICRRWRILCKPGMKESQLRSILCEVPNIHIYIGYESYFCLDVRLYG